MSLSRYWANFSISRLHRFLQPLIVGGTVFLPEGPQHFADAESRLRRQTSGALQSLPPAEPAPSDLPRRRVSGAGRGRSGVGAATRRSPRRGRTRRQALPARGSAGAQPGGVGRGGAGPRSPPRAGQGRRRHPGAPGPSSPVNQQEASGAGAAPPSTSALPRGGGRRGGEPQRAAEGRAVRQHPGGSRCTKVLKVGAGDRLARVSPAGVTSGAELGRGSPGDGGVTGGWGAVPHRLNFCPSAAGP